MYRKIVFFSFLKMIKTLPKQNNGKAQHMYPHLVHMHFECYRVYNKQFSLPVGLNLMALNIDPVLLYAQR